MHTFVINLARYHLNKNAPTSNPTFILKPDCMGTKPLSFSYNPAALSVSIRSHVRRPNCLMRRRTDEFFFFGGLSFRNLSDGTNDSASSSLFLCASNIDGCRGLLSLSTSWRREFATTWDEEDGHVNALLVCAANTAAAERARTDLIMVICWLWCPSTRASHSLCRPSLCVCGLWRARLEIWFHA